MSIPLCAHECLNPLGKCVLALTQVEMRRIVHPVNAVSCSTCWYIPSTPRGHYTVNMAYLKIYHVSC